MLWIKMVKRFGWRRLVSGGRRWQIPYAGGGLPRSSEATSLRGSAHRTESILIVLYPCYADIRNDIEETHSRRAAQ